MTSDTYDDRPAWALVPVVMDAERPPRFSANCMRAVLKATGRNMTEIMQDEEHDEDRFQLTAFAELYRRAVASGHMPDAATLWEWAGDAEVEMVANVEPLQVRDPLDTASSTTSPRSAITGE